MSKQLYEEALADVKKLKEVAEDNAKRALLEAVTPRIRDLIENQLMGELPVDDDKLLMDDEPPFEETMPASPVPAAGDSEAAAAAMSMPDEEGKVTLDLDALKVPGTDEYELSMESAQALGMLMNKGDKNSQAVLESKIQELGRKIERLSMASKLIKESVGYSDAVSSVISEVEDTYTHLQSTMKSSPRKEKLESLLERHYSTLNQLMEQKMNKRSKLSEADVTLKLTGLPDEIDLDSVGVDLITGGDGGEEEGGEEGGEEDGDADLDLDLGSEEGSDEEKEGQMESRRLSDNMVVEIDEGMLRREITRMKSLREAKDDVQSWGHGAGDVSDEFEDDDMGDPFLDVSLREQDEDMDESQDEEDMDESQDQMVEIDMGEEDMDESQEMDQAKDEEEMGGNQDDQSNKQSRQPGATVEGLRRRLAAEARIQLEAKKKAQGAKKQAQMKSQGAKKMQKEAQKQASQGKKTQAQQNKKVAQKKMQEAKQLQAAYNFYAKKFNESVVRSRRLQGMLSEAVRHGRTLNGAPARSAGETSNLRNKLAETNLFNAKLLFTNKLLQNESLTKRQKAEVIERLDEAKNEREVKLVYESLTKTLAGSSNRTLSESTDRGVIGSSSRPARPAAASNTLNEGFEADRWAKLAGIVK